MTYRKTITTYSLNQSSPVTGRHWTTIFDAYGRIVYSVHGGKVHRSSLFFPESTAPPTTIAPAALHGRTVFERETDVVCIPDPPINPDPEFEAVLMSRLYRPNQYQPTT
jgi:hypothetical protein